MEDSLSVKSANDLDSILAKPPMNEIVSGIAVYNSDGRRLYASDPRGIDSSAPSEGEMKSVLDGKVVTDDRPVFATKSKSKASYLDVLVPLEVDGKTSGVIQIYLPFNPIAELIGQDNHQLYLILLMGFTLFYAILFRLVARASSKLQRQAQENEYQALHDSLTELPNRSLFLERANQALLAAKREQWSFAVMIMDLDRFKEINDTLGHHHGDQVLQQIGGRLEPLLRERHGSAPGRRRVRHPVPARRGSCFGPAYRGEDAELARASVLRPGAHARCRRQHRHRGLSAPRQGHQHAPAARRCRDVCRQEHRDRPRPIRPRTTTTARTGSPQWRPSQRYRA